MSTDGFKFAKPALPAKRTTNPPSQNDKSGEKPTEPDDNAKPKETENDEKDAEPVEESKKKAPPQDFNKTLRICHHMLIVIRALRKSGNLMNEETMKYVDPNNNNELTLEELSALRDIGTELETNLAALEKIATFLPEAMPELKMNKWLNIYTEEAPRCNPYYNDKIETLIDASNWAEGQYQYVAFLSRFLGNPMAVDQKKVAKLPGRPLPPPAFHKTGIAFHLEYIASYEEFVKSTDRREYKFHTKVHSKSASGSVIEFKIYENGSDPKNIAHTLKILFVEKLGVVKHVNLAPPNQEWEVYNNYSAKQINPYTAPRNKIYQAFNRTANIFLHENNHRITEWTMNKFYYFITSFVKYRLLVSLKCKGCKRHLHNFMPPTIFDRIEGFPYHEPCLYRF